MPLPPRKAGELQYPTLGETTSVLREVGSPRGALRTARSRMLITSIRPDLESRTLLQVLLV
eukprot:7376062-Prymnesium_polylepis.1